MGASGPLKEKTLPLRGINPFSIKGGPPQGLKMAKHFQLFTGPPIKPRLNSGERARLAPHL